jgi:hypothetical protein
MVRKVGVALLWSVDGVGKRTSVINGVAGDVFGDVLSDVVGRRRTGVSHPGGGCGRMVGGFESILSVLRKKQLMVLMVMWRSGSLPLFIFPCFLFSVGGYVPMSTGRLGVERVRAAGLVGRV